MTQQQLKECNECIKASRDRCPNCNRKWVWTKEDIDEWWEQEKRDCNIK